MSKKSQKNQKDGDLMEIMQNSGLIDELQARLFTRISDAVNKSNISALKPYRDVPKDQDSLIASVFVLDFLKQHQMIHTLETIKIETNGRIKGKLNSLPDEFPQTLVSLVKEWSRQGRDIHSSFSKFETHQFRSRIKTLYKGISSQKSNTSVTQAPLQSKQTTNVQSSKQQTKPVETAKQQTKEQETTKQQTRAQETTKQQTKAQETTKQQTKAQETTKQQTKAQETTKQQTKMPETKKQQTKVPEATKQQTKTPAENKKQQTKVPETTKQMKSSAAIEPTVYKSHPVTKLEKQKHLQNDYMEEEYWGEEEDWGEEEGWGEEEDWGEGWEEEEPQTLSQRRR